MHHAAILTGAPIALRALVEGSAGAGSACALRAAPGGGPGETLVALCRAGVTPERAAAWAAGLFAHVAPQRVVCASALQVGWAMSWSGAAPWIPDLQAQTYASDHASVLRRY